MAVSVVRSDRIIQVTCPYNPSVPERARALGGVWTGDSWAFERAFETDVRELFLDVFQEFGEEKKE